MPSAMVDRQILPRQTKRTDTGSAILDVRRVNGWREAWETGLFSLVNAPLRQQNDGMLDGRTSTD